MQHDEQEEHDGLQHELQDLSTSCGLGLLHAHLSTSPSDLQHDEQEEHDGLQHELQDLSKSCGLGLLHAHLSTSAD